jgi:hypothetical protein
MGSRRLAGRTSAGVVGDLELGLVARAEQPVGLLLVQAGGQPAWVQIFEYAT